MRTFPKLFILALAVSLMVGVTAAGAQGPATPVGTLNLNAKSVSAGVGFTWGDGWLAFRGQNIPVKIDGLTVAAVGITEIKAIGDVYNLKDPSDIEGTYVAAGAGFAVAGGVKGFLARNGKGVVIDLVAAQKGVALNLGAEGFTIRLKR
jgi:hypothetical protein